MLVCSAGAVLALLAQDDLHAAFTLKFTGPVAVCIACAYLPLPLGMTIANVVIGSEVALVAVGARDSVGLIVSAIVGLGWAVAGMLLGRRIRGRAVHDHGRIPADSRLAEASALAEALEGHVGNGVLTPRQAQVVVLLIDGLRDGEIAETLALAPRTVQTHIRRIYGRLGIHSRQDVAGALLAGPTGRGNALRPAGGSIVPLTPRTLDSSAVSD